MERAWNNRRLGPDLVHYYDHRVLILPEGVAWIAIDLDDYVVVQWKELKDLDQMLIWQIQAEDELNTKFPGRRQYHLTETLPQLEDCYDMWYDLAGKHGAISFGDFTNARIKLQRPQLP